jgi:hypothetical protein
MKTVYDLWHWPNDNTSGQLTGRFPTAEDAMQATDIVALVHPVNWRTTPSEALVPAQFPPGRVTTPWVIAEEQVAETDAERIELAVKLGLDFGQTDGGHHKMWVIDQMLRHLLGDRYEQTIADYLAGEDGPDTYDWDEGIAP